jgi:uncharacterized protein (DUF433 family)
MDEERITCRADVCGGRPCIRNTRMRVKDILDLMAAGATSAEIRCDYPYLELEDIAAALRFASSVLDDPILPAAA